MTYTMAYVVKTRKYYIAELLEDKEIKIMDELGYLYYPSLRMFNKILKELE